MHTHYNNVSDCISGGSQNYVYITLLFKKLPWKNMIGTVLDRVIGKLVTW